MVRTYSGKDLAKILIFLGIIENVFSSKFKIVCPFHGDVNPSMIIDLESGDFFCFACESRGNALDFIKLLKPELNDLQCAIVLEQIINDKSVKAIEIKYKKKKRICNRQSLIEAEDYYYGLKTIDWTNAQTEEQKHIIEYMGNRGFSKYALNLGKCKENCDVAYPIIFPILDNRIYKGWVCRTTNKFIEKKRKYLYNDGFIKRDTLCGIYEENCIVVICEGFLDYLSIKAKGGIINVVAILGWHISDLQIQKLKDKGITTVISALDNDECGKKGKELLKKFFNVIDFPFPDGIKDPGEMNTKQFRIAKRKLRKVIEANNRN